MNEPRYEKIPVYLFPPEPMAADRGGNALALPIIFSFMLLAFGAGCAVGWWAWS